MNEDCERTYRLLHDYLDRELDPAEARFVQDHLDGCGVCAEEFRFEASVLRRLRVCLEDADVPEDLFARVSLALDGA